MKPFEGRKRRFGDRKDGFRVRNMAPMEVVVPYIMPEKSDAWVLFEDSFDVTNLQKFLRKQRKAGWKGLTTYHVLFASLVRVMATIPQINRFVGGSHVYARNEIKFAMVVKKGMHFDGDRTIITPRFDVDSTLRDVFDRVEEETSVIDKTVKVEDDENGSGLDKLEILLAHMPSFILSFAFFLIRRFERHGWLPKALTDLSPFHTSVFVTNMGSMGVSPVFHHVYNLGTLSIFVALGKQYMKNDIQLDGTVVSRQMMDVKVVVDERITDGFVYASAFKEMHDILLHPEVLMEKPEKIVEDVIDRK